MANGVKASSFVRVSDPSNLSQLPLQVLCKPFRTVPACNLQSILSVPTNALNQQRLMTRCAQQELKGREDLEKFVQSQPDTVLTVVNVSSSNATSCVRVFAAIAALAKSFKGYAAFARLLYDTSDELTQLARELRVVEVGLFFLLDCRSSVVLL